MNSSNNVHRWFLHHKQILLSAPSFCPITQISGIAFGCLSKKRILPYITTKVYFLCFHSLFTTSRTFCDRYIGSDRPAPWRHTTHYPRRLGCQFHIGNTNSRRPARGLPLVCPNQCIFGKGMVWYKNHIIVYFLPDMHGYNRKHTKYIHIVITYTCMYSKSMIAWGCPCRHHHLYCDTGIWTLWHQD